MSLFRYDINALRAISVIAVLVYHFEPTWIPGGFAGVDVFFVISGFLMTGIIFKGIDERNFSLWGFVKARFHRILPPLLFLCTSLLIVSWFTLLNVELKQLSKHIISTLSFLSNINYWLESGYFDAGVHEKWLLHTWSLSVEWQFYIVYPIVLILLNKFIEKSSLKKVLLFTCLTGFGLSVVLSLLWQNAAYFLLPSRFWEMLAGGCAFLYPLNIKEQYKAKLTYFGLILIFLSFFVFSKDTSWPGYFSIVPVLGTVLVILSNIGADDFFNNKIVQTIGSSSYSIYLWHWPIVVFMYNYTSGDSLIVVTLIGVSLFVGYLSYCIFEKRLTLRQTFLFFILTNLLALVIFVHDGVFKYRELSNDERNAVLSRYKQYIMDPTGLFSSCNSTSQFQRNGKYDVESICIDHRKGGVLLWGDSHMGALSIGLRASISETVPFSQLTSSGCSPSFTKFRNGFSSFDKGCDFSNKLALDVVTNQHPEVVIIGAAKNHKENDWLNTIHTLKKLGVKEVLLIGPFPQWRPSLPLAYVKRHFGETFIFDSSFDHSVVNDNEHLSKINSEKKDFIFIDILNNICTYNKKDEYKCQVLFDHELITFDYGHLTTSASKSLVNKFIKPYLVNIDDF